MSTAESAKQTYASAAYKRARLSGVVLDAKSSVALSGATVVLTSPSLQGAREAMTGVDGAYTFELLPPGIYTVAVRVERGEIRHEFRLEQGQARRLELRLELDYVGTRTTSELPPGPYEQRTFRVPREDRDQP